VTRYGYFLASEEHEPQDLVRQAGLAEEAGFDAAQLLPSRYFAHRGQANENGG
jgi:hypothetical protein